MFKRVLNGVLPIIMGLAPWAFSYICGRYCLQPLLLATGISLNKGLTNKKDFTVFCRAYDYIQALAIDEPGVT